MNIARTVFPISRHSVGKSFLRKFRFSSTSYESAKATQPKVQEEKFDFEDLNVVERTHRRKAPIDPFMKDVFISVFNRELLAYPEVLNKEETENLDHRVSTLNRTFCDAEKNETDRLNALKQSKLFAAPASLTDNGLDFNVTERLRYLETVSTDLKLARQLSDHWIGLECLKKGLKSDEYQKLLPHLSEGDNKITLCLKEPVSTRIAQPDFKTVAELDGQGVWRINGEKEIYRSVDGYLLVLCSVEAKRLKMVLVTPKSAGLTIEGNMAVFRDTPGILLDTISDSALSMTIGLSRLDTAVLSYSVLKEAIQDSVDHVRGRYISGKPLAEVPSIRARVGGALLTLYAAESTAYFTAGLLDGYENPDADMEMALCRQFTLHHCVQALLQLQQVAGLQTDARVTARMDEIRRLAWDETDDNVNMFIALNGIHHAGRHLSQEIKKIRNPLLHPSFIFKKVFADRHQENDNPKLNLHLAEHLHPSLKTPSESLEYSVLRMRFACECLMGRHGVNVAEAHTELERLSHAAMEILAMTAVLSRASRAYCIGLRNADIEMKIAACFVEKTKAAVRQLILDVNNGEYLNLDHYHIEFGRKVLDTGSILVEKPTERVFW